MVGTGVFTTTGFLLRDLGSVHAVLLAWVVGGAIALFGALAYGELGAALPHSGGEYALLGRIYHPALGFLAGWISAIVGFAAPIAGAAIAFGKYSHAIFPAVPELGAALFIVFAVSVPNALRLDLAAGFQNAFTLVKILGIVALIGAGLWFGEPGRIVTDSARPLSGAVFSRAFAVGLIFVLYSYSGWNAVAYVAGEIKRPNKNIPLGLILGTLIVTALYFGLTWVFLASTSPAELSGVVEIGHVASVALFGDGAGALVSALIALGLVSSVGAMVLTGARVLESMGRDYAALGALGRRSKGGGPAIATVTLAMLSTVMVLTASFDALLTYAGLTLSLSTAVTVAGVTVLRRREPELRRPYRALGHPVTSAIYIALMAWIIFHAVHEAPWATVAAAGTLVSGGLVYLLVRGSRTASAA